MRLKGLNQLLQKQAEWIWKKEQNKPAFQKSKQLLLSSQTLAVTHFDLKLEIVTSIDVLPSKNLYHLKTRRCVNTVLLQAS